MSQTGRACACELQRADTNNWIEHDASRPGAISVGRRGAGPRGRRMRRECPNDRRPTRPAADGCRHLPWRRSTTPATSNPPGTDQPLTEPSRSEIRPFARPHRSAVGAHAAAAIARSRHGVGATATRRLDDDDDDDDGEPAGDDDCGRCHPVANADARRRRSGAAEADRRGARHGRRRRASPRAQAADRRHPPGATGRRRHLHRRPRSRPSHAATEGAAIVSEPTSRSSERQHSRPADDRPTAQAADRCSQEEAPTRHEGAQADRLRRWPCDLDADTIERRRGRERNGRPIGRYLMAVQVRPTLTQVAVLEGRTLIEHYVSRPADDVSQIHGNIYLGKVQNVLPGMEAAFVDIGTPEERRAVPRRRAVRPGRHRREVGPVAHRADAAPEATGAVPGHQEPDQRQGRPPHPGGLAAGSLRRADPQLEDLRHLQAPARRRAQAAAQHPRPGQARRARPDRAHRRRERQRARVARRHDPAARPVERHRGQGQARPTARRCSTANRSSPCG